METQNNVQPATWLKSIISLIRNHDFDEAYILAGYFPATNARKLVQCCALIAQHRWEEADDLLKTLPVTMQALSSDFAYFLEESNINFDLLSARLNARWHSYMYLYTLYLEFRLARHPEAAQKVIDGFIQLILTANLDLAKLSLDRAIELDNSPTRLLQYAERVLRRRQQKSEPTLVELARSLIDRALSQFTESVLDPDIALGAAQALVEGETDDYEFVVQLLHQALPKRKARRRTSAISVYLRLSELANNREHPELCEEFLSSAVNLSANLREFLKLRAGDNLSQQLLSLLKDEAIIIKVPRYGKEQEADTIASLIKHVNASQRRETLFELLDQFAKIPINRLTSWLAMLFETNLQLTAWDLKRIELLTKSFPAELKESIKAGVSRQAKIPGKPRDLLSVPRESIHFSDDLLSDLPRGFHLRENDFDAELDASDAEWEDAEGEDTELDIPAFLRLKKVETQPKTIKVERHTRINFPSSCVLDHRVDLRIQLTKDIPEITRALQQVILVVDPGTEQITLDVQVTAPAFAIQQSHKPLVLFLNGDSEEIAFTLIPLEEGEQVIEIEFFHGSLRVGYVLIKTRVSDRALTPQPSNIITMEDPIITLKGSVSDSKRSARRTLHVSWINTEGKLSYSIYSENPDEFGEWEQTSPRAQEEIADYLRNLNVLLSEVVSLANPTEEVWESISLNLQSVCESLFKALIPSQIAKHIQKWEQGSSVIISTNEQWIPWELMYDGQCFWGDKFIIARYPRLNDRRNVPDTDRPEGKNIQHIRRVVNVIGGEVTPNEAQRAIQLFSMLPPTMVKLLKEEPVSVLQRALPGTDALHCTCHGYLEPHLLRIASDKSRIQNILPETVQKLPLEIGSLVFVNACTSTVPVLTFGKFSSFGWEFYRRGTGVFVGTLGAVPTRYAVSFAEAVYRELFRKDMTQTIGQAISSAKKAAAKEHNLFWLFYCIYGDPDFTIKYP